ncbi:MAG: Mth938-like domain-containing protein [Burkholderiaceae bacterium]|mgnify:CR=1 FL=1|nr:Mth938-like domain-containing protein [Burkholderiaceae bacterium]
MKLHVDTATALNTFTAYGPGYVEVNRLRYEHPVLVAPEGEVAAWDVEGFDSLTPAHFEALLARAPEIVLLGTGERQRFPHPRLTAALAQARIGVDVMDTRAACRTYNILMLEGRRVLVALLMR